MSAWTKLLAASQLLAGTAWQLISSPKTGGAGVVVNDGVSVELAPAVEVALEPIAAVAVEVAPLSVEVALNSAALEALLSADPVVVELGAAPVELVIAE